MKRRRPESGFALLLVFVMAAAIAITLYMEIPRVAFESQRTREQLAIDRGLQYQRAIQLFYRKYRLFPQTLDDLETTRNIRFLRRRYKDPLTGKDYRLLHVGPAGQLTDSLVQPPAPLPGSGTSASGNSSFGSSSFGSSSQTAQTASANSTPPVDPNNPNGAPDPLNMAARRPSDRIIGGPGGGPGGNPAGGPNGPAGGDQPPPEPDPNQPQQPVQPGPPPPVGLPVALPTDPNQPGNLPNPTDPNQPGIPGQPTDPSQPAAPVQFPPGVLPPVGTTPGQTGQPPTGQTPPGQSPVPQNPSFPQFPGQPAGQLPGQGAPGPQTAANLIQTILTTPRQPPSSIAGFTSGNTGGIAGVASTAEGKGIHKVNDRNKYKEWEFVYDLKKDKSVVGAAAVNAQQNFQQNQSGTNNPLGSSPFGNNSSSPFNLSPTSSPSQPQAAPPAAPTAPPPQ